MKMFNTILNAADSPNLRVYLQQELELAGLDLDQLDKVRIIKWSFEVSMFDLSDSGLSAQAFSVLRSCIIMLFLHVLHPANEIPIIFRKVGK